MRLLKIRTHFSKRLFVKQGGLLPHTAPLTDPPGRSTRTAKLPKDTPHRPEVEDYTPGIHR